MTLRVALIIGVLLGHGVGIALVPHSAVAESNSVLISEIQNASTSKSSDEFVELYNPSSSAIVLDGWSMQYRSATAGSDCTKSWTNKATITSGTIAPHGFYLLATSGAAAGDASFASGLASAGAVRIVDSSKATVDAVAWGSAVPCGSGTSAPAPAAGQSIERRPGSDIPDGGNAINTGDNSSDFNIRNTPEPQNTHLATEDPIAYPTDAMGNAAPVVYAPLEITELLVDPVSPATDATDEFVEIHNPGTEPVQVSGYTISTGGHQFHLQPQILPANGYMIVTSGASTISLSNTGGTAQLLDPSGAVIDTTAAWDAAIPGAGWALFGDTWQWTLTPTPAAANQLDPAAAAAAETGLGGFAEVELNELLPDPAAPATDANDEFIELYNPNTTPVSLAGYALKTGSSLGNKYVFGDITMQPATYLAVMSSTSRLTLANDGSSVALFDPSGAQIGTTITYSAAKTGQSWARFDDSWAWTTDPTPNQPNVLEAPAASASTSAKTAKPKAAATPKAGKVKAASTKKPAKAKTKAAAKSSNPIASAATSTGGRWLLFALAALTIGYIIYEYRYDLRNRYLRLRGHAGRGNTPGQADEGRGSDRAGERSGRGQDDLRAGTRPGPRLQW